jgi:hypothetical protein
MVIAPRGCRGRHFCAAWGIAVAVVAPCGVTGAVVALRVVSPSPLLRHVGVAVAVFAPHVVSPVAVIAPHVVLRSQSLRRVWRHGHHRFVWFCGHGSWPWKERTVARPSEREVVRAQ